MKKNEWDSDQLRFRFMKSILLGAVFFVFIFYAYYSIKKSERIEGASAPIRKTFLLNEKLSRFLFSPKTLSLKRDRPKNGTPPRVNGLLGLESPINLQFFTVEVNSGEKNLQLNLNAFKVLPKKDFSTEFRCIEGWSEDIHYSGPTFSEFMKFYDLGKKPDGSYFAYVGLETPDHKYYVSIDMESMLHEQTVLAYEMNGRPLSNENGAPIRLIIPIKYGIKSLKRIGRIYFSDTRPPDYWAERGYDWYSGL